MFPRAETQINNDGPSGENYFVELSQYVAQDELTGASDGINTSFQLSSTPIEETLSIYIGGLRAIRGSGEDYVVNGKDIEFSSAPTDGVRLIAEYFKSNDQ